MIHLETARRSGWNEAIRKAVKLIDARAEIMLQSDEHAAVDALRNAAAEIRRELKDEK